MPAAVARAETCGKVKVVLLAFAWVPRGRRPCECRMARVRLSPVPAACGAVSSTSELRRVSARPENNGSDGAETAAFGCAFGFADVYAKAGSERAAAAVQRRDSRRECGPRLRDVPAASGTPSSTGELRRAREECRPRPMRTSGAGGENVDSRPTIHPWGVRRGAPSYLQ